MLICIIIGLIVGGITLASLLSQLHSVHNHNEATEYIQKGSLHVTQRNDMFLYKKTERMERSQTPPPPPGNNH